MCVHFMQCIDLSMNSYIPAQAAYLKYQTLNSILSKTNYIGSHRTAAIRYFMHPVSLHSQREKQVVWLKPNTKMPKAVKQHMGCMQMLRLFWHINLKNLSIQNPGQCVAGLDGSVPTSSVNRARGRVQPIQSNCCHHNFILCKRTLPTDT